MTYEYCCILIKNTQKMKSKEQIKQELNGSTKKPSPKFLQKLRQARIREMNELYEKGMREYREKNNQPPENQI